MNDRDLHKLIKEFSGLRTPKLPAHQKMLRARLLSAHANQQTSGRRLLGTFGFTKSKSGVFMSKKLVTIGASALAISLLAVGIMAINGPQQTANASQLIEGAAKRAQLMSPEELANFNQKYQQDLNRRLEEAKKSGSLKVLSSTDLTDWGFGPKREETIKSYIGYIDNNNHRIIIGLNDNKQPLFVVDITIELEAKARVEQELKNNPSANEGATLPSNDAKTPKMEVNQ